MRILYDSTILHCFTHDNTYLMQTGLEPHSQRVLQILEVSAWHMETLVAARGLCLPDWAIGAGFIRNAVWDRLHEYKQITPLCDVDVLYFDAADLSKEREQAIEAALRASMPDRPWSVRNQARMHLRNDDAPYSSTEDALRYWLETPTCVAVRLEADDSLTLFAPYGLVDLLAMRASPTTRGEARIEQYISRMKQKNWPSTWPKVTVTGL